MNNNYEIFDEIVKSRRSVRSFTEEPVSVAELEQICETSRFAMSGGNSQPWEFLIVTDKEKIQALRKVYAKGDFYYTYWLEQQRAKEYRHPQFDFPVEEFEQRSEKITQELNAPGLICLLYDPRKQFGSVLAARANLNDGDRSVLTSSMGHLSMLVQLTAASMGLQSATCYSNQQEGYRKVLGYPEPVTLYSIACIGHGAYEPGPAKRLSLSSMVHYNSYDMNKFSSGPDILDHIREVHGAHGSINAGEENE